MKRRFWGLFLALIVFSSTASDGRVFSHRGQRSRASFYPTQPYYPRPQPRIREWTVLPVPSSETTGGINPRDYTYGRTRNEMCTNWFANYGSKNPLKDDPIKRPAGIYVCSVDRPGYRRIGGFQRRILEAAMSAKEFFCARTNLDREAIEKLPVVCNFIRSTTGYQKNHAPAQQRIVLRPEDLAKEPYSVKPLMQVPSATVTANTPKSIF